MYKIIYARSVITKDMPKLKSANLVLQFFKEIDAIKADPFIGKLLTGPLKGKRSVRIKLQHRIFYIFNSDKFTESGIEYEGTISILQAFGHDFN
jgi:Txe/YoeB family toxin of Txe-Axe toxin-antitoxin module